MEANGSAMMMESAQIFEEVEKLDGFKKTEDPKKCRFCVYRSHCDRGVVAGDLSSFEVFDTAPETFKLDTDFEDIAEIEY